MSERRSNGGALRPVTPSDAEGFLSGVPLLHTPGVLDAYPPDAQQPNTRYVEARDGELRAESRAFCEIAVARLRKGGEIQGDRMDQALNSVLAHDAAGPAREARLQAIDGGFGPSDITCPVDIWHFEGDTMVPFEAARRSAESLRHVDRHFIQGGGHVMTDAMLNARFAHSDRNRDAVRLSSCVAHPNRCTPHPKGRNRRLWS